MDIRQGTWDRDIASLHKPQTADVTNVKDKPSYSTHPHILWGFPDSSIDKEFVCSSGDPGSIPGWEDTLERG